MDRLVEFPARSVEDTERLAEQLAECCEPGLVVALKGDLGAGKTTFVRAVARGLGVDPDDVSSPTFVLVHEYSGRLPVYHMDAYRLAGPEELVELGADEYFFGDGVCLVEWADRVEAALPEDRLEVQFEISGERQRRVRLAASGARSARVLERLRRQLGPALADAARAGRE